MCVETRDMVACSFEVQKAVTEAVVGNTVLQLTWGVPKFKEIFIVVVYTTYGEPTLCQAG